MIITEIIVSAGRTFNHPYESYSNLKPQLTLKATIQEGDDVQHSILALQDRAETMIEQHKQQMLADMEAMEHLRRYDQQIASLETEITKATQRLEQLKQMTPKALATQDDLPF